MAHNPERLSRLRSVMGEQGIDVLYVRELSNISWATGFERVFDDESAHALVVSAHNCVLHTDSRYFDAMKSAAADTDIEVDNSRMAHSAVLAQVSDCIDGDIVRVGIEDSMPLAEYRALQRTFEGRAIDLVELSGFVEELRQVKDESEITAMRKAQSITDAAFANIIAFMKPGMTEREVQLQLDRYMYEEGAEGLAFGTIVATGAHAASPHAIPGETKLAFGDAVVMDFGARYAGYCSDMTRTVFVGEPSDEVRRAYGAIRRANEECEAMLRAGLSGADVHQHAEPVSGLCVPDHRGLRRRHGPFSWPQRRNRYTRGAQSFAQESESALRGQCCYGGAGDLPDGQIRYASRGLWRSPRHFV